MKARNYNYEDLIFENRNKLYGAYDLRVNYEANLMRSFFICISSLLVIGIGVYLYNRNDSVAPDFKYDDQIVFKDDFIVNTEIDPPAAPAKPLKRIRDDFKAIPPANPAAFKLVAKVPEPAIPPSVPQPPVEIISPIAGIGTGVPTGASSALETGGNSSVNLSEQTIMDLAFVDKQPMFPGGMEGFYKFLSQNMRFPDAAKKEGISAKLFVSFVINKDGELVDIVFLKKAGYGMEESVSAVLEKSPKWIPGEVMKQHVNTKMILPVNFNLIQ